MLVADVQLRCLKDENIIEAMQQGELTQVVGAQPAWPLHEAVEDMSHETTGLVVLILIKTAGLLTRNMACCAGRDAFGALRTIHDV